MIRTVVCDDEKNIRSYLVSLIEKQDIACEIAEYASAEEYFSSGKICDLLFLDINLSSGASGIHMAEQIRERECVRQPLIVFVTGYEDYVYDAFDVEAFQYLLKPVDEKKFSAVFQKAAARILQEEAKGKKTLLVRHGTSTKAVPLEDIYYAESCGHKITLHLKSGQLEYYAGIGTLEKELQGQFCRIHKGYLVNLRYVDEYTKTELTLAGGDRLLISKYKYADFVKAYLRFLRQEDFR